MQELDDEGPFRTLSPAEVHKAVANAGVPDHHREPSAWCVVGSKDEILFLSKAKHRADIFAEGTSNAVEPLYRKRAPSGD